MEKEEEIQEEEEDEDVDEMVRSVHDNLERLVGGGEEGEDDDLPESSRGFQRHLPPPPLRQQQHEESLLAQFLKRFVVCTSLLLAVKFVYPVIMVLERGRGGRELIILFLPTS